MSRDVFDPQELAQTPLGLGLGVEITLEDGEPLGVHGKERNPISQAMGWLELDGDLFLEEGALQEWYEDGLVLVQRHPSSQGYGQEKEKEKAKVLVLAPQDGLRCLRGDYLGDTSYMLTASVAADASNLGLQCHVDGLDSLRTACERFVWWDRPSQTTLNAMAGGVVEIVGATEVYSKHRVGVRLLSEQGPGHIIDALPVECLTIKASDDISPASTSARSSTQRKKAEKRAKKQKTKPKLQSKRREVRPSDDTDSTDNSTIDTRSGVFSSKREIKDEVQEHGGVKKAVSKKVIPAQRPLPLARARG